MRPRWLARGVRWFGFAALALWVIAPLVVRPGMPLFVHDWVWSPFAERTLWTWRVLVGAWDPLGLGAPNSGITLNPLALLKLAPALVLDGRDAQLLYLAASLVIAFAGVYRLARENLELDAVSAWIAVALFAGSPFFFSKIASGQSSYWAATAAFVWGTAFADRAFARGDLAGALRAGACFALATLQLQFLVFAWVALALLAVARRSLRSLALAGVSALSAVTLAVPELWYLAARGPQTGAGVSPSYPFWRGTQSSSMLDALAGLGYQSRYVEHSVEAFPYAIDAIVGGAIVAGVFGLVGLVRPRPTRFAFAGFAAIGWAWIAGIDGPAAAFWNYALSTWTAAGYLREFYHGAVFLGLGLAVAAAAGVAEAARRARVPALVCGIVAALGLGTATWTFGLARVLPAVEVPDDRARIAASVALRSGGLTGRVAFLPMRQPLSVGDEAQSGNDGADWVDDRELSLYRYYLDPPTAAAVDALHRGDSRGATLLERLGCDAAVVRGWVVSRAYGAEADADSASLASRFVPGDRDKTTVARLHAFPLFGTARRIAALPADARDLGDERDLVYLDLPGDDADRGALPRVDRPDPSLGWVARRDLRDATLGGPGGYGSGLATTLAGARTRLLSARGSRALVWAPSGVDLGGRRVLATAPTWIPLDGEVTAIARGPAAVYETGERELSRDDVPVEARATAGLARARLDDTRREAPWHFSGTLWLDGAALVVLRERYDRRWTLTGDGMSVVSHVRADGFANAWFVRGHGRVRIEAAYAEQATANALLAVSALAFIALVVTASRLPRRDVA